MRAPIVRVSAFAFSASAVWALLPLVAREELKAGPAGYGVLLAAFGAGSVAIAGLVPGLLRRHHPDTLIAPAIVVLAGVLVCLGFFRSYPIALAALFAGGIAWVGVLVQFNVAVQLSAPKELRGRALSFYLVFFQGSLGIGSAFHGWLARQIGIHQALVAAGLALLVGLPLILAFPLKGQDHGST
jgi:predicted MFS family arabinose efflux permease